MIKLRRALLAGFYGSLAVVALAASVAVIVRYVAPLARAIANVGLVPVPVWLRVMLGVTTVFGGMVIAVFYAFIFEFITRRAGWLIGALLGGAHGAVIWLGAGLGAWLFPGIADLIPGEMSLLFDNLLAIAGFMALHVIYGAIVGATYKAPKHSPAAETRVRWRELYSRARPG